MIRDMSTRGMDPNPMLELLEEQKEWDLDTFGPGRRTLGILRHIVEETGEVAEDPEDLSEWVDMLILASGGAMRQGYSPQEILEAWREKLEENKQRDWPDWRMYSEDVPIRHIEEEETA